MFLCVLPIGLLGFVLSYSFWYHLHTYALIYYCCNCLVRARHHPGPSCSPSLPPSTLFTGSFPVTTSPVTCRPTLSSLPLLLLGPIPHVARHFHLYPLLKKHLYHVLCPRVTASLYPYTHRPSPLLPFTPYNYLLTPSCYYIHSFYDPTRPLIHALRRWCLAARALPLDFRVPPHTRRPPTPLT